MARESLLEKWQGAEEVQLSTVLDLRLSDSTVYRFGRLVITSVRLHDVGLVGAKEPVPNLSKSEAASDTEASQELVSELARLGLPTAFGKKGNGILRNHEGSSRFAPASRNRGAQKGDRQQCPRKGTAHGAPGSGYGDGDTSVDGGGCTPWVQGFDEQWGCHYYYNTQTQESVWEAPAEGYVPWEEPAAVAATEDVDGASGLSSGTEATQHAAAAQEQVQLGSASQPVDRAAGSRCATPIDGAAAASLATPDVTAVTTPGGSAAARPSVRMLTEEDLLRAMGLWQERGSTLPSAHTVASKAPDAAQAGASLREGAASADHGTGAATASLKPSPAAGGDAAAAQDGLGLRDLLLRPSALQQAQRLGQQKQQQRSVPPTALSEEQLLARLQGAGAAAAPHTSQPQACAGVPMPPPPPAPLPPAPSPPPPLPAAAPGGATASVAEPPRPHAPRMLTEEDILRSMGLLPDGGSGAAGEQRHAACGEQKPAPQGAAPAGAAVPAPAQSARRARPPPGFPGPASPDIRSQAHGSAPSEAARGPAHGQGEPGLAHAVQPALVPRPPPPGALPPPGFHFGPEHPARPAGLPLPPPGFNTHGHPHHHHREGQQAQDGPADARYGVAPAPEAGPACPGGRPRLPPPGFGSPLLPPPPPLPPFDVWPPGAPPPHMPPPGGPFAGPPPFPHGPPMPLPPVPPPGFGPPLHPGPYGLPPNPYGPYPYPPNGPPPYGGPPHPLHHPFGGSGHHMHLPMTPPPPAAEALPHPHSLHHHHHHHHLGHHHHSQYAPHPQQPHAVPVRSPPPTPAPDADLDSAAEGGDARSSLADRPDGVGGAGGGCSSRAGATAGDADPSRKVVTWTLEALERQLELMAAQALQEGAASSGAEADGVGESAAATSKGAEPRASVAGPKARGPGTRAQRTGGAAPRGATEDGDGDGEDDAAFYDTFAVRGGGERQTHQTASGGPGAKLPVGADDGTRRVTLDPGTAAYVRALLPRNAAKYWMQRYSLFSRFDEGVQLDTEGWWSVTPEVLAEHQALRCRDLAAHSLVALDACCGCGGNVIQMASVFPSVMGVEISERRVEMARHNAEVYGVSHKCHFICADFFQVAPDLKVDVLFTSPPWGGPKYQHVNTFDVFYPLVGFNKSLLRLLDATLECVRSQDGVVAAFLPRNTDLAQLASVVPEHAVWEVERAYVNNKLKGITVYCHAGRVPGQPNVRLEAEAQAQAGRAALGDAAPVEV